MQSGTHRPENIPPPVEPAGIFTGIQIRPIISGVVTDYVATYLFGFAYLAFYFGKQVFENGELSEEAIREFLSSPESLLILGVIGTLCTVLGGFVAGRLAKSAEIKHGAFVGGASLILSTLEQTLSGQDLPIPEGYQLVAYLVAIPAGALGGYFAQRLKEIGGPYRSRQLRP